MLYETKSWMYSLCVMDVVLKEHAFIQRWFSTFLLTQCYGMNCYKNSYFSFPSYSERDFIIYFVLR